MLRINWWHRAKENGAVTNKAITLSLYTPLLLAIKDLSKEESQRTGQKVSPSLIIYQLITDNSADAQQARLRLQRLTLYHEQAISFRSRT